VDISKLFKRNVKGATSRQTKSEQGPAMYIITLNLVNLDSKL